LNFQRPIIIAHRGASAYAEDNTLESFEEALRAGADMIEFDVRRTKDGILIAHHDRFVHGKPVSGLTYGEIEEDLRARHVHVPRLEEVLDFARGRIGMDVEIKEEGYEDQLIELVRSRFGEDGFVVTSFNDSSVRRIKDDFPWVRTGLILGRKKPDDYIETRFSEFFPMKRCRIARADFLVPHFRLLRFGFLSRARRNNKPVYVWTVNDEKMMERFARDSRIEAIITDRPDLAVRARDKTLRV